ncbi:formyltransferase family protein [Oligoflexia bacterium]|nr:formyltransferase family protein [Oligoflexia bacterium]
MIKFAIAGKLDYFGKGNQKLQDNGYTPTLAIPDEERVIDYQDAIKTQGLELLICLAHPHILTSDEIALFPKGCINLHSGIPNYCGRHPVNWMIIDGLQEIPVAVHYMNTDIDGGDIIVEDSFIVEREDDYASVLDRITALGADLILAAVKQIESATVYPRPQILPRRYIKKRTPADSKTNLNCSSVDLHRFICSLVDPMPNAFATTPAGQEVRFQKSYVGKAPGEVLAETLDGRYVIATQDGVILVATDKKLKVGDKF